MPLPAWIILIALCAMLSGVLLLGLIPSPGATYFQNMLYALGRAYARLVHRPRITGLGDIPAEGPLIIVANHTAGIDPILVGCACPRPIRWVMAQDMRVGWLEWFWRWQGVIFVGRDGYPGGDRSTAGLRGAIAHLKAGGVVGIFPEGGLERPPRQIMPFQPGIGLLIRRSGARVLPAFIDGTPQVDPAWASLWRLSRSTIHFAEPINFTDRKASPAEIAGELRAWFIDHAGWPANNAPIVDPETGKGSFKGKRVRPVSNEPTQHSDAA